VRFVMPFKDNCTSLKLYAVVTESLESIISIFICSACREFIFISQRGKFENFCENTLNTLAFASTESIAFLLKRTNLNNSGSGCLGKLSKAKRALGESIITLPAKMVRFNVEICKESVCTEVACISKSELSAIKDGRFNETFAFSRTKPISGSSTMRYPVRKSNFPLCKLKGKSS